MGTTMKIFANSAVTMAKFLNMVNSKFVEIVFGK